MGGQYTCVLHMLYTSHVYFSCIQKEAASSKYFSIFIAVNPYRKTNIKPIRPDGFHSSASDKELQKR